MGETQHGKPYSQTKGNNVYRLDPSAMGTVA